MWEHWGATFSAIALAQLRSVRPMNVAAWVDAGARAVSMEQGTASLVQRLGGNDGDSIGDVDAVSYDGAVALRAIIFEALHAGEGGDEDEGGDVDEDGYDEVEIHEEVDELDEGTNEAMDED